MESLTILDNEEFLRQKSEIVDLNDKDLENDIKVLEKYCEENEVLAMAAVQLGIPKRIVYLKNTNLDMINKYQKDILTDEEKKYNERKVLINPVIINKEGETEYWEACASCLELTGLVRRPYKIEVEYYNAAGEKENKTFEGFETTVLCHEIDHLDGILHFDIAEKVVELSKEQRKELRQREPYRIISKK